MRTLQRFWFMSGAKKHLLAEATLLLGTARLLIIFFGHERWSRMYGKFDSETEQMVAEETIARARQICHGVRVAARWVPWNAVCLPQALTAKWMLGRRHIPSTLYVGLRRAKKAATVSGDIELHAWLRVGTRILTGKKPRATFQVLAKYG